MKRDQLENFLKSLNIEFNDFLDFMVGKEIKFDTTDNQHVFFESDILKFLEYYHSPENKKISIVFSNPGNSLHKAIDLSILIFFYNKNIDYIKFVFNKIPIKITQFDTKGQILETYINDLTRLKR